MPLLSGSATSTYDGVGSGSERNDALSEPLRPGRRWTFDSENLQSRSWFEIARIQNPGIEHGEPEAQNV